MVVTMLAVLTLSATALATTAAVDVDQPIGRADLTRKVAYASAEAGLQAYMHRLTSDPTYWTLCTGRRPTGTTTNGTNQTDAVNQWWNGSGADTRRWANLPDNSGQYTVEQLPANGENRCDTDEPVESMIDNATATFRVRITGRALSPQLQPVGIKRSIVATFKRKSFLDYIYFTDLEVLDPTLYPSIWAAGATTTRENPGNNDVNPPAQRGLTEWGNQVCAQYHYATGPNGRARSNQYWSGTASRSAGMFVGGRWQSLSAACTDTAYNNASIRFFTDDSVEGPFHTNDTPMICGSPDFGRSPADAIEVSAPGDTSVTNRTASWRVDTRSGCGTSEPDVNFNGSTAKADKGSWLMNQPRIELPPTNQSLAKEAPDNYTFLGNTSIVLGATTITVTGKRKSDGQNLVNQSMAYPPDGVMFVQNDPSMGCTGYLVDDPYQSRPGCGIASVRGTYGKSLTIGAADDVLITSNIINGGGGKALLGLIAQNFIRVQHRITGSGNNDMTGSTTNQRIDAALLTLKHSFLVDNWGKGAPLGTMTVTGAISQKFRGPVATGSGRTTNSGYVKNYVYDDRLRTLSPPKFLDPVKASWRLEIFQEQSPAL